MIEITKNKGDFMNLTGVWLGQTIGKESAIHVWIISQRGNELFIYTHWLGLDEAKGFYWAMMNPSYTGVAVIQHVNRYMNIINQDVFTIRDWIVIEEDKSSEEVVEAAQQKSYDLYFQRRDKGIFPVIVNAYISIFRNSPSMLRQLNR